MSEFMKAVVTEALERNRPKRDGPIVGGANKREPIGPGSMASAVSAASAGNTASAGSMASTVSARSMESTGGAGLDAFVGEMPAIKRPNYQREKTAQRLAAFPGLPRALPGGEVGKQAALAQQGGTRAGAERGKSGEPASPVTRRFVEQALSPLLRQTLTRPPQAESRPSAQTFNSPPVSLPPLPNGAKLLGMAADKSWALWFFPTIREELRQLLGVTNRRYRSIGLAAANRCTAAHLFAVDELFGQDRMLEIELQWSSDAGKPFELKLYGEESTEVDFMMHKLSELSKRLAAAHDHVHVFSAAEPSPLLTRYLGIRRQDAVAVISGLCRLNRLGLLDRLLERYPALKLNFHFTAHDLILTGSPDDIAQASLELKKEAGLLDGKRDKEEPI